MQAFTTRWSAILCLALALSVYCYAQNLTIGNDLPCGDENLNCFSNESGVCYNRSELCNGVGFCPVFAEDEGGSIINALDCAGAFGTPMRYRCNAGTQVLTLDLLCDGNADCVPGGDDETNALCANKCRLPFYGGCSYTRQCASSTLNVSCGDCLFGLVDVGQPDCVSLCSDPVDPINGMVAFTGNQIFDTATYTCNSGFELVGEATAICTQMDVNSAAFDPAPPLCRPLCSNLTDIVNGMVTFTGNSVGDTATYTCNSSFELIGSAITTCTQEDVNSAVFSPAPVCRPLCPVPVDPVNGMVTVTGNSVDDTATYSCNSGFELVGSATATCTQVDVNSAAFSPVPPVCRPLCSDPADPVNGMATFTGNSVDDTADYSCSMGFELVGSATATCMQVDIDSAAFSPASPVCRPLCPDPVLANGMVTLTGNSINDTATYTCNPGFELIGSAVETCTQINVNSATFSPVPPVCRPLCTDPPGFVNGIMTFTGNSISDTATYTCNMGFDLFGSATTTCTAAMDMNSASFIPAPPVCRQEVLPSPTVLVVALPSSTSVTAIPPTTTAEFPIATSTLLTPTLSSNSASSMTNSLASLGVSSGVATATSPLLVVITPTPTPALCPEPPAIVNGMRTFTGNSVGDTATYSCNAGFELIGNLTTMCTQIDANSAAFLVVPPPECRPLCPDPPAIVNGMRTFTGNTVGDTATYTCNIGFELNGDPTTTCMAVADGNSATFSAVPPLCSPLCADPVDPANGMVTFTGNSVGDSATYTCNTGFELIGSASATCVQVDLNSSAFPSAAPVCRPLCPEPVDPANGMVTFTGNSVGDSATYTCNTGFELIGSASATCVQVDLNSSAFPSAAPVCRPLCADPVDPVNGMVTFTGNSVGDSATYTCNTGFELIGSAFAVCAQVDTNSSAFSLAAPLCSPLCPDPPALANAMVTFTGNSIGDTVTYTCDTGFVLIGNPTTTCTAAADGNSATFPPVPPSMCSLLALCPDPPALTNGMRTFTGNSVGDTAIYTCDISFELIGDPTSTCTAAVDGNSATFPAVPPVCRPLCPDPADISNGMVTFAGNSVGETATFTCNPRFELIGSATMTCTQMDVNSAAFQTSPLLPECRHEYCLNINATRSVQSDNAQGNTTIFAQLSQIEERLGNQSLTGESLEEIIGELATVISVATDNDQTTENLQVVIQVFIRITALLDDPMFAVNEQIVINAVAIVADLQRWPEAVIAEGGPEITWSLETALIDFVRLENFITFPLFEEDIILIAERVELELLQSNGRGFFISRTNNGTLCSITGDIRDEGLTPEEIGLILLPASLFETLTIDIIGLFFLLYENASPFPVAGVSNETRIGSPVIAATVVAGEQIPFRDLEEPVIIALRLNPVQEGNITRRTCVSWDFSLADGRGNWTSEGCTTEEGDDPDVVVCQCNHLTNFAVLVDICTRTEGCELSAQAQLALDVISYTGIGLSMLGLILTLITLLAFNTLRQRDATKFHIQLCIAIFCSLLVFVIGIDRVPPKNLYGGCVAVSALIQYFILVAFMWMGAEAVLMFEKLVIVYVRITTRHIIAASIICWTLPIVAVAVPLGIDRDFMLKYNSDVVEFCFIGDVRVFFGAFLGPIGIIVIFNSIIFVIVAHIAIKHRRRKFTLIFRLIGVTYLFGLTWVFGFLTIRTETSLAFQILFVIFNAFQGFFLFLFFCVLSKDARKSWKRLFQSSSVSRIKASNPQILSGATRPTAAETSNNVPSRSNDLQFSTSEGLSIGSETSDRDTNLGGVINRITVIENHHVDFNGRARSHAPLAGVASHEQVTYTP